MARNTATKNTFVEILGTCTLLGTVDMDDAVRIVGKCLDADGKHIAKWDEALEGEEHGYGRMWLLVRYVELWLTNRQALVDVDGYQKERKKAVTSSGGDYNANHEFGRLCASLREPADPTVEPCSWGEISVRTNTNESKCRKMYELATGKRSAGQRKGMGGRFVADRGDLYVDNLKVEGVVVPVGFNVRAMSKEDALNYRAPVKVAAKTPGAKAPKGKTMPTATKAPRARKMAAATV